VIAALAAVLLAAGCSSSSSSTGSASGATAAGKAVGIPNLAALAFLPLGCDPDTYQIEGLGSYCATATDATQTYTVNVGDARYFTSQDKGLHGIFVYDSDVPSFKITFIPQFRRTAISTSGRTHRSSTRRAAPLRRARSHRSSRP
jgi:hypothetical protein